MSDSVLERESRLGISPLDEHNRALLANVHPAEWPNPTPADNYNLVVIGGGSAGLVAAAGAAGLGARVALVERHLLGGDCLNVGCVPSKTLIRASRVMAGIAAAPSYGIYPEGSPRVDFAEVMARVRMVRATISPHDSAARFRELGVDVFFGEARFTAPDRAAVAGATLRYEQAMIATGSRPAVPAIPGLVEAGYLTNEDFFNLTEQPRRLAVIGAGPIGAELAQAMARLGSEVVLFDVLPRVLGREDEEAATLVEAALRRDGVRLELDASVERVEGSAREKRLDFRRGDKQASVTVDAILVAVGREPNVEGLGLELAGVEYGPEGVTVDDALRTTNERIYAGGDVALPYQFTHAADASARIVVRNALFPGPDWKFGDQVIPWVTYTDPEVAQVGVYEYEARERGKIDLYRVPLRRNDRALADGESDGFVKLITKRGSDRIIGATIVAPHAGEMIGEVTLAMTKGIGLGGLTGVIHPYPTQAAAIRTAADDYNRARFRALYRRILEQYFRWRRR